MFAAGWDEEVRGLIPAVPAEAPAWNASGYGAVRAMVEGRLTANEARERVIIETRQYAKRQRTWFRHQLPDTGVERLDVHEPGATERLARWFARSDEEHA
jgi:tRNA dimethylallyltransferase